LPVSPVAGLRNAVCGNGSLVITYIRHLRCGVQVEGRFAGATPVSKRIVEPIEGLVYLETMRTASVFAAKSRATRWPLLPPVVSKQRLFHHDRRSGNAATRGCFRSSITAAACPWRRCWSPLTLVASRNLYLMTIRVGSVVSVPKFADHDGAHRAPPTNADRAPREPRVGTDDRIVAPDSDTNELAMRGQVAESLVSKGAELWMLGRAADAVSVYDEVLSQVGGATELALRAHVAGALNGKGVALGTLGRLHESVLAFDEVLERFGEATEPALRALVANALVSETMALMALSSRGADDVAGGVRERYEAAVAAARSARPIVTRVPGDYLCRVCGYPMDEPPWDCGIGSQEICPSCGIQFGYDDARTDLHPRIYHERRERWVTGGMQWCSTTPPPDGWDPHWQLLALAASTIDGIEDS
jgi:hypothetical protein